VFAITKPVKLELSKWNCKLSKNKIYEIRCQRVMPDIDLAELYGTETKRLKEEVRRNMERFEGNDFIFELTKDEIKILSRTQFATLNKTRGYNINIPLLHSLS